MKDEEEFNLLRAQARAEGERNFLRLLSAYYRQAGVPEDFAARSAAADYELFREELQTAL